MVFLEVLFMRFSDYSDLSHIQAGKNEIGVCFIEGIFIKIYAFRLFEQVSRRTKHRPFRPNAKVALNKTLAFDFCVLLQTLELQIVIRLSG